MFLYFKRFLNEIRTSNIERTNQHEMLRMNHELRIDAIPETTQPGQLDATKMEDEPLDLSIRNESDTIDLTIEALDLNMQ